MAQPPPLWAFAKNESNRPWFLCNRVPCTKSSGGGLPLPEPFKRAIPPANRREAGKVGLGFRHLTGNRAIMRKPSFEAPVRADVDLYSTDQLRTEYHAAQGGHDTLIRLRNSNISRAEIEAEIRWRVRREECRFWFLAVMAFVAALAGCTSVGLTVLSLCAK
jgi:hypothetical protein